MTAPYHGLDRCQGQCTNLELGIVYARACTDFDLRGLETAGGSGFSDGVPVPGGKPMRACTPIQAIDYNGVNICGQIVIAIDLRIDC